MITAVIAYFAIGSSWMLIAQMDLVDPAIELGGIGLFVTGAAFIVRYILKAVERSQAANDAHNMRLEQENERLRLRIRELEKRLDDRPG